MLLAASAIVLAWQTKLFDDLISAVPFFGSVADLMRGTTATETGGTSLKEAARPLSIVITHQDGGRYGVKYDIDERNAVYERTSSIFSESLGSASPPVEISEGEWRAALSGPGIYFEYMTPVSLAVLNGWLGVRMPETAQDMLIRRLSVEIGEDRNRIYFQEHESGLYFGADTASTAGKAQELGAYNPNGAMFAFETGVASAANAPYMLIMPGSFHPDIRATAAGSAEELLDISLFALGFGNESPALYIDSTGVLVGVTPQFNIRVDTYGGVLFRRIDGGLPLGGTERTLSESEMIELARAIVADALGGTSGGAEIFFESFTYAEDIYSVFFGYYIAGGRVHLHEDGYAARISFRSGAVTEAELNFRSFSVAGERTGLMPERQALAAAGGEFMLCYSCAGFEILHPFWVKYGI